MEDQKPKKWPRVPKIKFTSRDITRRVRKVEGATVKHARRFVFRRISNFKEVRRHIALWVLTAGLIIGASGLQLLWYQQSYRTVAYASDGTYAEAVLGPVNTLNPIFASTSAEESVSDLLFGRLLTYDTTGNLNYDLASNMTISKDNKTYTFEIRADAKWQDGIYVRAKDVVFTVNLIKNPATRSTITGWDDITVKEINDRTVSFSLPSEYAAFPHALNFLPILPEHILRDVEPSAIRENSFSNNPTANGPFTLRFVQEMDRGAGRKIIHLARNGEYYKGAPKLERFQLHVYNDTETIVRALNTSEVNAAVDLSVVDTEQLNKSRYSIKREPVNSAVYAMLNTTSPILKDKAVRQALQIGTDTKAVRDLLGADTPEQHLPFIASQVSGALPAAPKYDKAAAERLLDKAGWKLQDGVRVKGKDVLRLSLVTTKNNDFERALSQLVEQWSALGIVVSSNIVDTSNPTQNFARDILQPRNYDVLLYQLTIGADPDVYAYWHSSQANGGFNFSNYKNTISDDALASARSTTDQRLRNVKYISLAKQWLSDAPAIGLYQATVQYVYSNNVHVMPMSQALISSNDRYADVLYWSVGNRIVHQTP